jgi:hypothetical protein
MICIIAGGRDYYFTLDDIEWLKTLPITTVVSGMAKGADTCGKLWAEARNIPVIAKPANWELYGRSAGFRRNVEMAIEAEALAVFPGGKGTQHMIDIAKRNNLTIWVPPYHNQNVNTTTL